MKAISHLQIQQDGIFPTFLGVAVKRLKGPTHMVEGGHHIRNAPNLHPQAVWGPNELTKNKCRYNVDLGFQDIKHVIYHHDISAGSLMEAFWLIFKHVTVSDIRKTQVCGINAAPNCNNS